ncbi:tryptophan synthase subunit alpha [Microbacteriaceae bacterium 4G12]
MSKRIKEVFQALEERQEKAFVPYIMAGDGGLAAFKENIILLDRAEASILEIGIPFSDPVADGPTIQRAGKRALDRGTTLTAIFQVLTEVRADVRIPFVLMTYLNPILAFGIDSFITHCVAAGVDGIIVPDLPFEEQDILAPHLQEANIALIPLVTITSPKERIAQIVEHAQGFIYAVTVTGVTGAREEFQASLYSYLQEVKQVSQLPVLAGFGISTPSQIAEVTEVVDGVVIGSRIIDLLQEEAHDEIQALIDVTKRMKHFL